MTSDGSCDTKDWGNDLLIHQKFSCAITQINYFLKHYKLEMVYKYCSNISQY